MFSQDKKYVIYKAVNIKNGKVYIGATTISLEERKKDHLRKAENGGGHYFQHAIATYGAQNFKWQQIDTASSNDELAKKEKLYIKYYNSNKNGYNSDKGGGIQKTIFQFNMDGTLNNTFSNLASAAASIGVNKKTISKACFNIHRTTGGFYWCCSIPSSFFSKPDKRKKSIIQYDVLNNFLEEYTSISEAASKLNISKSGIAKCCRGERKSCGGYYWNFA